jgi:hypothetical protein
LAVRRDAQQLRDSRQHIAHPFRVRDAERRRELGQPPLRRLVATEAGVVAEPVEHRVQRARPAEGRAGVVPLGVPPAGEPLAQGLDESRLADPRLAGQQGHLTPSRLGPLPALEQPGQLRPAPDEVADAGHRPRPGRRRFPGDAPGCHRGGKAAQGPRSEVLAREHGPDQPAGGPGDQHRAGLGQGLEPGGQVRGLADHLVACRRGLGAEGADHDQPRGDADPDPQRGTAARAQPADCLGQREPGAYGALGRVLLRPGPAEVGEHAVADVLGDMAPEAHDRLGGGGVVGADDLPQVLRVEPRGELGRADQVGEHHRELPTLGLAWDNGRGALALGLGSGRSARNRRRRPTDLTLRLCPGT